MSQTLGNDLCCLRETKLVTMNLIGNAMSQFGKVKISKLGQTSQKSCQQRKFVGNQCYPTHRPVIQKKKGSTKQRAKALLLLSYAEVPFCLQCDD